MFREAMPQLLDALCSRWCVSLSIDMKTCKGNLHYTAKRKKTCVCGAVMKIEELLIAFDAAINQIFMDDYDAPKISGGENV